MKEFNIWGDIERPKENQPEEGVRFIRIVLAPCIKENFGYWSPNRRSCESIDKINDRMSSKYNALIYYNNVEYNSGNEETPFNLYSKI